MHRDRETWQDLLAEVETWADPYDPSECPDPDEYEPDPDPPVICVTQRTSA